VESLAWMPNSWPAVALKVRMACCPGTETAAVTAGPFGVMLPVVSAKVDRVSWALPTSVPFVGSTAITYVPAAASLTGPRNGELPPLRYTTLLCGAPEVSVIVSVVSESDGNVLLFTWTPTSSPAVAWKLTAPTWPAVPTLAAKLESLRILGLASLGGFIAVLAWMRMPPRLIVMAALNPALWLQFVANAHNDMLAVLCVTLGAALTMRSQVLPAVACIVAAGLIKAPYAVLGLLIFTGIRRPARRYATMSASLALTALLSLWLGGAPYLAALTRHVVSRTGPEFVLHALAALVAAVILLAALLGFGRLRSGAFLMPALAAALFPWYLAWSIPYALSRQRDLACLLVAFPAAAALLDTVFFRGFIGLGALVLTLACAILLTLRNRSRPILDAG